MRFTGYYDSVVRFSVGVQGTVRVLLGEGDRGKGGFKVCRVLWLRVLGLMVKDWGFFVVTDLRYLNHHYDSVRCPMACFLCCYCISDAQRPECL